MTQGSKRCFQCGAATTATVRCRCCGACQPVQSDESRWLSRGDHLVVTLGDVAPPKRRSSATLMTGSSGSVPAMLSGTLHGLSTPSLETLDELLDGTSNLSVTAAFAAVTPADQSTIPTGTQERPALSVLTVQLSERLCWSHGGASGSVCLAKASDTGSRNGWRRSGVPRARSSSS